MSYHNPYYMPSWGSRNVRQHAPSEFPSWGSENVRGYGDSSGPFEQPLQQGNYGQMAGNAGAGLAAGAGGTTPNQFSMDSGAVLGSVASGFATGGPIGGLVAGVTSVVGQNRALKENINNVNTNFNVTTDMYGRPTYSSGEFTQGFQDLRGMMDASRPGAKAMLPGRRKQLEQKTRELYEGIQQGQQAYNQAEGAYRDRNLQLRDYFERINRNYIY